LICDTCGKEATIVSRVVIDRGYNRADAKALWNCPECYERKERERLNRHARASTEEGAVHQCR
jgi:hypothetical protein